MALDGASTFALSVSASRSDLVSLRLVQRGYVIDSDDDLLIPVTHGVCCDGRTWLHGIPQSPVSEHQGMIVGIELYSNRHMPQTMFRAMDTRLSLLPFGFATIALARAVKRRFGCQIGSPAPRFVGLAKSALSIASSA